MFSHSLSLRKLTDRSIITIVVNTSFHFIGTKNTRLENRSTIFTRSHKRFERVREIKIGMYSASNSGRGGGGEGGSLRHLVVYYPISFDKFQDRFSNVSPADKAAWQTRRQRIFHPSSPLPHWPSSKWATRYPPCQFDHDQQLRPWRTPATVSARFEFHSLSARVNRAIPMSITLSHLSSPVLRIIVVLYRVSHK